jgi:hypothetical protein
LYLFEHFAKLFAVSNMMPHLSGSRRGRRLDVLNEQSPGIPGELHGPEAAQFELIGGGSGGRHESLRVGVYD